MRRRRSGESLPRDDLARFKEQWLGCGYVEIRPGGKAVRDTANNVKIDFLAAQANERSLQASLDQKRGEAQDLNRASIQYGVLQRDATSNQTMFAGLLERSRETGISGELKTNNIRIVDQAETPRKAASPNKVTNLSLALLGGAFLGIGLAFFFEYLDSHIKQPEEIKTQLGLPFLGMVALFNPKETTGPPLIGNGMPHEFSEAFRGIRTNVLFSSADAGSKSIVVTSTGPGEGKSVVSANLAMSLALAGQRVLLIDADMRRPKVHELFGVALEPGLSNVMVGDAKASETVKRTLTPNLWLMTSGKHPPKPGGATWIAAIQGFHALTRRALRLGDHRHAASHGGHGCERDRAQRHGRGVRGWRRDDQQRGRQGGARTTRLGEGEVCRRHPEPRGCAAQSVLLRPPLPPGVSELLRKTTRMIFSGAKRYSLPKRDRSLSARVRMAGR